jgi:2-dehydro-3-deoxygalactonokinase
MSITTTRFFDIESPALLALDWGTSSLRAFLLDQRGKIAMQREAAWGIQQLPSPPANGGFDHAFELIAGDWLVRWPLLPVISCGMVGSAQGWLEAPYVSCPADLASLSSRLVSVKSRLGSDVHIAPGLFLSRQRKATGEETLPDVMRGEEVQILGALSLYPEFAERVCMVLPGTHSKWAWAEAGTVVHFMTSMAGELFSVLRQHSILARLMPAALPLSIHLSAFEQGVERGYKAAPGKLITLLFSVRSMGLAGELPSEALPDYLSGLLIGAELAAALRGPAVLPDCPLVLLGLPVLTQRYGHALAAVGHAASAVFDNTAPQGLWQIALAAGLVPQPETLHVA